MNFNISFMSLKIKEISCRTIYIKPVITNNIYNTEALVYRQHNYISVNVN